MAWRRPAGHPEIDPRVLPLELRAVLVAALVLEEDPVDSAAVAPVTCNR
jgi:hypothetical protein